MALTIRPITPAFGAEISGVDITRPLDEAILGTWRMGPTSVSFMPNGTMVATLPGGRQQQGRWSIGADGRLHADAPGLGQAAEAWVAGDTLTVAENGQGLSFKRATGA